jgi:anti-repressor protein
MEPTMNELITITTGGQGSPVVSARELYRFLGVKKQFADWIKARIEKYGFVEHRDYETFSLIGEKGRPTIEYALTLNMAKELSMVEGNERGKEARQFFIDRDDQLRQATNAPLSTEQVLIQLVSQQTQLLTDTQQMLSQLRADVDQLQAKSRPTKPPHLKSTPQLNRGKGPSNMRQLVTRKVNDYCAYHQAEQSEAYSFLYRRLNEIYRISAYKLSRGPNESLLDAVERHGYLNKIYGIIAAELIYQEEE